MQTPPHQPPKPLEYAPARGPRSFRRRVLRLGLILAGLDLAAVPVLIYMAMAELQKPAALLAFIIQPLPMLVTDSIGRRSSFWTTGMGFPSLIVANSLVYGFGLALIVTALRSRRRR